MASQLPGTERLSSLKLALLADRVHRNEDSRLVESEPIAIIGIAGRFPRGIATPAALWEFLAVRGDAISEVPQDRWDANAYFNPDPAAAGKINTRFGGFLRDVDRFDPMFFGIAPAEAVFMDPQQRLLLEVAWEAFDDAGLPLLHLRGSRTGVFFGLCGSDYGRLQLGHPRAISAHTLSGTAPSIASGRLSYLFDLRGPSIVIDTACSSSLVAVHEAVVSLRCRESDLAVAGGVSLNLTPDETISLAKWGMLSPDGRCKTFDARADGFVRSEGCGLVVLKRLSDALRDGDRVCAVIRSSAVNQDGRSNVLTSPNGAAQRDVIRAALRQARLQPEDITYVETHGTGTKVGDPIEVEALVDVLGMPRADGGMCHLGALKANLGHLEAAAGIAGLIKVALCLDRKAIPPQAHFLKLNPLISLDGTSLRIPTSLIPWETDGRARIAGLSSFGFSGTNAHVIVEEAPQIRKRRAARARAQVLVLSSKTKDGLEAARKDHIDFLASTDSEALPDVCFTAATRRVHHPYRAAVAGGSAEELRSVLANLELEGAAAEAQPQIVFIYCGQGNGWLGMGAALLRDEPVFSNVVTSCDDLLATLGKGAFVAECLISRHDDAWLADAELHQIVLFVLQVGLTELWRDWGIEPSAVAGHSVGEIAAAHAAGALELGAALELVVQRAALMKRESCEGAMAVAAVDLAQAEKLIRSWDGRLVVAAHNGPESVTVAGEPSAVEEFLAHPEIARRFVRRLPVDRSFHSVDMEPAAAALEAAVRGLVPRNGPIAFYSSVSGGRISGAELTAKYWRRNVRERVRFADSAAALLEDGFRCFIEIGPHPVLLHNVMASAAGREVVVLPSLRRGKDDRSAMLETLGRLHSLGASVQWARVCDSGTRCVSLPPYSWQRDRFWFDADAPSSQERVVRGARLPQAAEFSAAEALCGRCIDSPFVDGALFETLLEESRPAWLADHRLNGTCVVPGAALIEMALAASSEALSLSGGLELRDGAIHRALVLPPGERRRVQTVVERAGDNEWWVRIASREESAETGTAFGSWTTHFECRASPVVSAASDQRFRLLNGTPAGETGTGPNAGMAVDLDALYAELAERGITFGPAFRSASALHVRDGEADIALAPAETSPNEDRLILNPPRLDACLHAVASFFPEGDDAWLPMGFARLVLMRRAATIVSGKTRLVSKRSGELLAEVTVLDGSGACAGIEGLRMRAVSPAALRELVAASYDSFLHVLEWQSAPPQRGRRLRSWLVFADGGGVAERLERDLASQGAECVLVQAGTVYAEEAGRRIIDPTDADHYRKLLQPDESRAPYDVVAFLWALDANGVGDPLEAQTTVSRAAFHLLQAMHPRAASELWLVTCGAQRFPEEASVVQAPLCGLGAVVTHEYPWLVRRLIDLDPGDSLEARAEALVMEAAAADGEDRIAWSAGRRLVARLRSKLARIPSIVPDGKHWSVSAASTGLIEDLAPRPASASTVPPGCVSIEPAAVGVNFRDVLNALGMLGAVEPVLGAECAGRVVAVGNGVDPSLVGTRMMAFSKGSLASHVNVPIELAAPVPPELGDVEAAALPVAFLTVKYGLDRLAGLRRGESVLIHAASGGVGLAAVQLAQACGVTVFATAGSERKQAYVRSLGVSHVFSSRSTAFKDEILRLTSGRGVDVVLNCLADDFVAASVDVLAYGGRFVELGKRGIWSAERMARERPDVRFLPFDLSEVAAATPAVIRTLFVEVLDDLAAKRFRQLPTRSYDFSDLHDAFGYMANARHIGKLVIRMPAASRSVVPLRGDATYLIVGAAAGLAPALVDSLVARGARHLAFFARRAVDERARRMLDGLQARGVKARWVEADVASKAAVTAALSEITRQMPPLRGVFHLAAIIDDAPIASLTWERFSAVMAPKLLGAVNLHDATRDLPLDLFVLYSSVASIFGWPGQSAYACGNAYLDALARRRHALGLPATSINWGPWSESGLAADTAATRGVDFASRGFKPFTREEADRGLGALLEHGSCQAVAGWINLRLVPAGSLGATLLPACDAAASAVADPEGQALREALATAPHEKRLSVLRAALEREAARALGLKAGYRFDGARPLNELGLDSLLAVQLSNALGALLARPLPATLLFDYPSIDALMEHLCESIASLGALPSSVPPAEETLAGVSEAEAEAMLLAELGDLNDESKNS